MVNYLFEYDLIDELFAIGQIHLVVQLGSVRALFENVREDLVLFDLFVSIWHASKLLEDFQAFTEILHIPWKKNRFLNEEKEDKKSSE